MGARKKNSAEKLKQRKAQTSIASLNNTPTSPRKMRLLADLVRGEDVFKALSILQYSTKDSAPKLAKLLRSAIANWESKNEGKRAEEANLVVKQISVDGGRMMKRIQPAPQGRAHRVRKRSNHVTIIVDSSN
ncbi:MAG: 50S ribosomal protein L22 [Flavobacteriales bacterium]